MSEFRSVTPEELTLNPFKTIGKDWMLITPVKGESANPMTASWGGLGVLWSRPVAYIFLRPQRLTRELVDDQEGFSLNILDESFRKQYGICGSKSGRDIDKMQVCGFDKRMEGDIPYIAQAHTVLICKKLYRQHMEPGLFVDPAMNEEFYPESDHHYLYVAEITKALVKK